MLIGIIILKVISVLVVSVVLIDKLIYRIYHKIKGTWPNYPRYYSIWSSLIGTALSHTLFYFGGFYHTIGPAQGFMISVSAYQLLHEIGRNGQKKNDQFTISITVLNFVLVVGLLYVGGFYDF